MEYFCRVDRQSPKDVKIGGSDINVRIRIHSTVPDEILGM